MLPIKDCVGRTACMVDPMTGLVESEYKKLKTSAILRVGETFTIEREHVITTITRTTGSFIIQSRIIAA